MPSDWVTHWDVRLWQARPPASTMTSGGDLDDEPGAHQGTVEHNQSLDQAYQGRNEVVRADGFRHLVYLAHEV